MLEAHNEMHRVIAHFSGRFLRLEVERAETAVAPSGGVKLWIEIKDARALQIDDAQVGITDRCSLPPAVSGKSQRKPGVAFSNSRKASSKWLLTSLIRSTF